MVWRCKQKGQKEETGKGIRSTFVGKRPRAQKRRRFCSHIWRINKIGGNGLRGNRKEKIVGRQKGTGDCTSVDTLKLKDSRRLERRRSGYQDKISSDYFVEVCFYILMHYFNVLFYQSIVPALMHLTKTLTRFK